MSNHYHLVLTDVDGRLPDFMRDLNSMISRALNAFRPTQGENFARDGYNVVIPADFDTILRHCAYTEANPCRADLVEYAWQWSGVTSGGMRFDAVKKARRPKFGLWKGCSEEGGISIQGSSGPRQRRAPKSAELQLVVPPGGEGMSPAEVREEINRRVTALEEEARALRRQSGQTVLGMRAVSRKSFLDSPDGPVEMFTKEPRASGKTKEARLAILERIYAFVAAYRAALDEHKVTKNALFPYGTWLMHRHLEVRCATSPP